MFIIFHNDEVWDQYEDIDSARTDPLPLHALCLNTKVTRWWMWYHSWSNITKDIEQGKHELSPVIKSYLLLLEL